LKVNIGKLELGISFTELVRREVYGNSIELLEIQPEHLEELVKLPFFHKDPFDRLMIAQSLVENMPMVTKDAAFVSYPLQIFW